MKYRYLPATIMLSAGAITMFLCLYNRYEAVYSLKILLAVLIIFLIIGSLTRKALIKIINMEKEGEANSVDTKGDGINEDMENKENDMNNGQIG